MPHPRRLLRAAAATLSIATAISIGTSAAAANPHRHHLRKVVEPTHKYYGVYVSQAPASMAPVDRVTQQTGKQPNMSLFYNAWGTAAAAGTANVNVTAIGNACQAGMLPMLTWESWNTADTDSHGVAWSQPEFAPSLIAGGEYDAYIRAVADKLKAAPCPVALRLDQEVNSYWYPWGLKTDGMTNTASDYVAMWQHIWTIFHNEGVSNVLWVWSPNVQSFRHTGLPDLAASYPGDRYVDWVGIDGYITSPDQSFHDRFQPTFDQIRAFAPDKPWIIAECGVATNASKPHQLKNVVSAVARRKRLVGLNYFDTSKSTGNYLLDETDETLTAFKKAIANPVFAAGVPGQPPGV
ncbi:MAG: hypothetical protein JO246_04415 [Frankiaceae bacterium]|nr:hypothetical protein [Frankiaceae bacterium]MBV9869021.1 hypothetical protein [Frankiaceae bacterium]